MARTLAFNIKDASYLFETSFDPARDANIAVVDDSVEPYSDSWFLGGIIVTSYTGVSAELHIFSRVRNWMTRDFLAVSSHYVFRQLDCERVLGEVAQANIRALRLFHTFGFRQVATVPGMFASGAGVVVCLERTECRWLSVAPRKFQSNSQQEA
jgi:hypothetical protein